MRGLFILFFISCSLLINAQAPLKISYQGVARNSSGTAIANQQIAVKFDIHQGSATGSVVFTEQYTGGTGLTTNAFGLFTTYIGSVSNLGVINWANGPFFIEVFVDPANGTAYNSLGSQQLMSVPFALYAQTSGNSSSNPTITINSPNTVSNPSTGVYDISVPNPTLSLNSNSLSISNGNTVVLPSGTNYTAGNGITIGTGSVITNAAPDQTITITPAGSASVSGTYPNFTISTPTVPSYSAGNGIDISTSGVISNTLVPVIPTITINAPNTINNTTTGVYDIFVPANSTYTLTSNSNTITLDNGVTVSSATVPAVAYYTISANSNTITLDNGSSVTTATVPVATLYTLSSTSNSITLDNGSSVSTVTVPVYTAGNGIDISPLGVISNTAPAVSTTLTSGGVVNVTPTGSNSYLIDVPAPSLSYNSGTNELTLTQNGATTTATLNGTGSNTVSITGAGLASVTPTTGSNFTVSVPNPTLSVGSGSISISNGNSVAIPVQTLSVGGGSITISGGNSVAIPSSSTTLVQGNNITLNQLGNTYTVSAPAYSISLPGGNVAQITNGISTSTAAINATNLTLSGANNNILSAGGNTVGLNTYTVGNNLTMSSGPNYTISAASYSLTSNSNTLTLSNGSAVTTVTVPQQTLPLLTYTNNAAGGVLQSGPTTNTVSIPNYTLSNTSNTITLNNGTANSTAIIPVPTLTLSGNTLQSGPTSNTVSLSGLGGIYSGSGSIPTGSTTVSIGTNTLNFVAANNSKPIANFVGNGTVQPSLLGVANATTGASGIRFIGSYTTTPVNYGQVIGSASGLTMGTSSFPSALSTSTNGNVLVNTTSDVQGRFQVSQTSSTVNPHVNIISPTGANYGRFKYSNAGNASYFSNEAVSMDGDMGNSAWSVSHFNGSGKEFPVLLINGQRMTYINALNVPLTTFHVMTSTATASGGISSEGFAQAGQINIVRNNNAGAGIRTQVLAGEEIGKINFAGHDGSAFGDGAKIYAKATETITGSNKGTELFFAAVPTGTNSNKDAFKINGLGQLEVLSSIRIPGSPTVAAGQVLTAVDALGNASWQPISGASGAWTSTLGATTLVNTTDQVGIGTSTPFTAVHVKSEAAYPYMLLETSANHGGFISANNGGATLASPTTNTVDMILGGFGFGGYNVTADGPSAVMSAITRDNWNAASNGTALFFETTQNGTKGLKQRMMIDHNGYVGINANISNTFTPLSALHIETDGSLDKGLRVSNSNSIANGPSIYLDGQSQAWTITGSNAGNGSGANKFVIRDYTNAADRFVIDNTGKVGIGLVSPEGMFHVRNSAGSQIMFGNDNQPAFDWFFDVDGSANMYLRNESFGTSIMSFNPNNGFVGVGTNTAQAMLDVVSSGDVNSISASASGILATLTSKNTNASSTAYAGNFDGGLTIKGKTTSNADYALKVSSSSFEVFGIKNNGNIGVNVTNPNYKLTINSSNTVAALYSENIVTGNFANAHGIYGNVSSANTSTAAAAIYGNSNGSGPSVYGFKNATDANGSAGRFEILNTSNSADGVFVVTNGTGAAMHAVSGPTVAGSSNVALLLEGGHVKTVGGTPSVVTLIAGTASIVGNDIVGTYLITSSASTTADQNIVNVTFNKPYSSAPNVMLFGNNGATFNAKPYATSVTNTGFTITFNGGVAPGTYSIKYLVIQ